MFRGGRRDHLCGENSNLDKFLRPDYKCEDNTINLRSSGDKSSIMQIISQGLYTRVNACNALQCRWMRFYRKGAYLQSQRDMDHAIFSSKIYHLNQLELLPRKRKFRCSNPGCDVLS